MSDELLSVALGILLAGGAIVVWAVRLEGKIAANDAKVMAAVAANAASIQTLASTTNAAVAALQDRANGHDETKIEVVRLQEQIVNLTELIEKWLQPPPPARRTRSTKGDGG